MSKDKKPLPAEQDPDENLTVDPPKAAPAPPHEQPVPPPQPDGYGSGV